MDTITYDDFAKLDIRAGLIRTAEPIEKSKKLVKLEVDFGPEIGTRVILAGVKEIFPNRVMAGQLVLAVVNLAPRDMMGMTSHGMVLACQDQPSGLWLVAPGGPLTPGSKVS